MTQTFHDPCSPDASPGLPVLSRHARRRCQQRGVRLDALAAFLDHHDLDRPVGGNCRVLRMSRGRARTARTGLGPQTAERFERLAVILSEETGQIVSVMHDRGRSRRLRVGA